jgi:hypothetical protein
MGSGNSWHLYSKLCLEQGNIVFGIFRLFLFEPTVGNIGTGHFEFQQSIRGIGGCRSFWGDHRHYYCSFVFVSSVTSMYVALRIRECEIWFFWTIPTSTSKLASVMLYFVASFSVFFREMCERKIISLAKIEMPVSLSRVSQSSPVESPCLSFFVGTYSK